MSLSIGLTGGIASGKSTVSNLFKNHGIPVIDADVIAHEVVEIGEEAYEKIISAFSEEILLGSKQIDRAKLGAIIFNNKEKREILNNIVHPAVRKKMLFLKEQYMKSNELVILDIPLLFESGITHFVEKIIVVYVDEEIQKKRLMERNHFTEEEAKVRIHSQFPLKEKKAHADVVIDNNGTLKETKKQVEKVLQMWK